MASGVDRKEYSCAFTFSGSDVGTDAAITSSTGKVVENSKYLLIPVSYFYEQCST